MANGFLFRCPFNFLGLILEEFLILCIYYIMSNRESQEFYEKQRNKETRNKGTSIFHYQGHSYTPLSITLPVPLIS